MFHRRFDTAELQRIYGDLDHADALNDNTPPNTGVDRLAAAFTWFCIGTALFAFWAIVGRWLVAVAF